MNVIRRHPEKQATVSVYIDNSRTEITEGNFKVAVIQVSTNKLYKIELTATAQVRLVMVVKRDERPKLWDFYGGDRISSKATLLGLNFSATRQWNMNRTSTASGIESIRENNSTMTVTITGTVRSENDTANLYIGLMSPLPDDHLCTRCRARSEGPCGFCLGTTMTISAMEVNFTIGRYMPDCLFWDDTTEEWSNIGCEVSVGRSSIKSALQRVALQSL